MQPWMLDPAGAGLGGKIVQQVVKPMIAQPRIVFRAVERLAACAASPDGVHAFAQRIDLMQSIK